MIDSLESVFSEILEATRLHLSEIKPSEWYESRMIMPRGSAFPGPFTFDRTPYWREPLDCVAKDHPAKEISIMKGAQSGGTAAVLNPIVGYTITQNPGNIMFLTGHSDLSQAAFLKIDAMFDNCRIRHLIKPNVIRAKNTRSGDTDKLKEFPGGTLWGGSVTNHNLLRQYDVMVMIVDDFDAALTASKKAGNTRALVQQRTAAYAYKKKIVYVSSPQIKGVSNIEDVFMLGDQRYYNVPCPCCGVPIVLRWEIDVDNKQKAGITWKVDDQGNLIRKSVGYICQECAGFFDDSGKYEMNLAGFWRPTVVPKEENHYSYQISSLYSPPGMDDWAHYVQQYINANPPNGKVDEKKYQTFVNVVLGEPYEQKGRSVEANSVQKKIRNYKIDTIPETLSIKDGNGTVVMLTCACDLNGTEHDARLDYEITAWSESGSSYSVRHGSIGTFVPRENSKTVKEDRVHWTYEFGRQNCVWPELEKIINTTFVTDTERPMRVLLTGVDCGHYTNHAYSFIDRTPLTVIGIKGDKEGQFRKLNADIAPFKPAKERPKLFLLDVNHVKDLISANIDLRWLPGTTEVQPPGFMNFPEPAEGLYLHPNYFSHYESEHRSIETKEGEGVASRWIKKKGNLQNHFWDCFDPETEVLTSEGWMFFKDITKEHSLATVNLENNELQYQPPTELISKHYDGSMVFINGRRVNALVTENHRMVVYRKVKGKMSLAPEIVHAKDLKITDAIKLTCDWVGGRDRYYIIDDMKNSQGRLWSRKKIPAAIWASFIGLYVAEGGKLKTWNEKRGSYAHRVCIYQNKGKKFNKIQSLLNKMPFSFRVNKVSGTDGYVFSITDKQLYEELADLGDNVGVKRSGEWIKNQSVKIIKKFLDFAILGDGYTNPSGGHRKYYTISRLLADDVQELFIKTGHQGNIYQVQPKDCSVNPNKSYKARLQYHVSENKTKNALLRNGLNVPNFGRVEYSGMVYCATVPNGTLICRREGKSFVAGNCCVYNYCLKEIWADMCLRAAKPPQRGNWHDFINYMRIMKYL